MTGFSHLNDDGKAQMVDVGAKVPTRRTAQASGTVRMHPDTVKAIQANQIKKGEVLSVARLAGIMAAKQTGNLIPLCHPLAIDSVEVQFDVSSDAVRVQAVASLHGKTGVEMEAITAVSVAAVTIYDMCKSIDREMTITDIRLDSKTGGKSDYQREDDA